VFHCRVHWKVSRAVNARRNVCVCYWRICTFKARSVHKITSAVKTSGSRPNNVSNFGRDKWMYYGSANLQELRARTFVVWLVCCWFIIYQISNSKVLWKCQWVTFPLYCPGISGREDCGCKRWRVSTEQETGTKHTLHTDIIICICTLCLKENKTYTFLFLWCE